MGESVAPSVNWVGIGTPQHSLIIILSVLDQCTACSEAKWRPVIGGEKKE